MIEINPVFCQFRNTEKYLDKLIAIFHQNGWLFEKAASDYFHEFYWPDIVLSDKAATLLDIFADDNKNYDDNYTIELLGCYEPTDQEWKSEGRIILYIPKIRKTAQEYFNGTGYAATSSFEGDAERFFTEGLTTIILIHEFVHWIIHWIESPGFINSNAKNRLMPINYFSDDEISFHESIAQILTRYIIKDNKELTSIFEWLENQQPNQYRIYNKIVGYQNSVEFINSLLFMLRFIRQYNLQSFEVLRCLLENPIPDIDNHDSLKDEKKLENAKNLFEILLKKKAIPPKLIGTITDLINNEFLGLANKMRGLIAASCRFGL